MLTGTDWTPGSLQEVGARIAAVDWLGCVVAETKGVVVSENERRLEDRLDPKDLILRACSVITLILVAMLALSAI